MALLHPYSTFAHLASLPHDELLTVLPDDMKNLPREAILKTFHRGEVAGYLLEAMEAPTSEQEQQMRCFFYALLQGGLFQNALLNPERGSLLRDLGVNERIAISIVTKGVPWRKTFLDAVNYALGQKGYVYSVMLKASGLNPVSQRAIEARYQTTILAPGNSPRRGEKERIKSMLAGCKDQQLLLDIGGKWAPYLSALSTILGCIEDTRNGEDTYRRAKVSSPIFSVAATPEKRAEDWPVGQSLVYNARKWLAEINRDFAGRVVVLGFGPIGQGIARSLRDLGVQPYVVDIDPQRQLHAHIEGYLMLPLEQAISSADVLFVAIGGEEPTWTAANIRQMKDEGCLIGVTSRDATHTKDAELYLRSLPRQQISEHVTRYERENGAFINYILDGNAANSADPSEDLGVNIILVQGLILATLVYVATRRPVPPRDEQGKTLIHKLPLEWRNWVLTLWLDMFAKE